MEKTSVDMDLDEWEFLPDDEFLDPHHHEDDGKGLFSREMGFDPKGVLDMNYFICPSPISHRIVEKSEISSGSKGGNQLVLVPTDLEPTVGKNPDKELVKKLTRKVPIVEISIISPVVSEKIKDPNLGFVAADQDMISHIFFKKMKENEFVDMKTDSPKSGSGGIKPQIEARSAQFEVKEEAYNVAIEKEMVNKNKYLDSNIKEETNWEDGGLSIWRWKLTGIGPLCCIGVAAASICIFVFGSRKRHKFHQNQKLQFQIYAADDKSIKQMVHQETILNHAISAVRSVPLIGAHINFGDYYDAL